MLLSEDIRDELGIDDTSNGQVAFTRMADMISTLKKKNERLNNILVPFMTSENWGHGLKQTAIGKDAHKQAEEQTTIPPIMEKDTAEEYTCINVQVVDEDNPPVIALLLTRGQIALLKYWFESHYAEGRDGSADREIYKVLEKHGTAIGKEAKDD